MKNILLSVIAAGALSFAVVSAPSMAQADVHVGIGIGDGGGWRHHRPHCRWIPVWRHHHRMMMKQCGWGGGDGMHGGVHMGY